MERLSMKRIFSIAVITLIVAFCFGQMALAEEAPHHSHAVLLHAGSHHSDVTVPKGLFVPWAYFTTAGANFGGPNSDGSPLWPCFGDYDGTSTTSEDKDCPTIGDPSTPFGGGVV